MNSALLKFPETIRVPFGKWVSTATDWFVDTFDPLFEIISNAILWMLLNLEDILLIIPWWVYLLLVVFAGIKVMGNLKAGLVLAVLLFFVGTFELWDLMMRTLAIVGTAVILSIIAGIPVGILMSRHKVLDVILRPVLDAMQTMPSFVYLIPAMMLFGLGKVPAVIATIIYAIPPTIRLTNLGIRMVPREMVEASLAFGSTKSQLLTKVQLPLAMPSIMAGINQTTMMALAMVVIASMIGARGLGELVLLSITRLDIGLGAEAGISIVIMAIILDRIMQSFGQKREYL